MKKYYALFTSQGYENVMIRDHESSYEVGQRSILTKHSLLEYKTFQTEEYELVGTKNEGNGNSEILPHGCV